MTLKTTKLLLSTPADLVLLLFAASGPAPPLKSLIFQNDLFLSSFLGRPIIFGYPFLIAGVCAS